MTRRQRYRFRLPDFVDCAIGEPAIRETVIDRRHSERQYLAFSSRYALDLVDCVLKLSQGGCIRAKRHVSSRLLLGLCSYIVLIAPESQEWRFTDARTL